MTALATVLLPMVPVPTPGAPPGSAQFLTILNWVSWVALAVCVAGVIFAGLAMIISSRRGEGGEHMGKLGRCWQAASSSALHRASSAPWSERPGDRLMKGTITMSAPEESTGPQPGTRRPRRRRRGGAVSSWRACSSWWSSWSGCSWPSCRPATQTPIAGGVPRPRRSTSAAPAARRRPRGASCLLGDQTVPVTPPADTEWELVGRVVAPTAPEVYGPAVTDPVRSCFARTPTGALYAAVNASGHDHAARRSAPARRGPGRRGPGPRRRPQPAA